MFEYRGYIIQFNPPPIPQRDFDWEFTHKEYDHADDRRDPRIGWARTAEAAKAEIDEMEGSE